MVKKLFVLLMLVASITQAQYTVKGTISSAEGLDWVLLQKLEGTKQKYLAHTNMKIENIEVNGVKKYIGKFEFTLPKGTKVGMYRVSYKDKGAGFVDFLFNNEDIELSFDSQFPEQSVIFAKSEENKLYSEYKNAISLAQKELNSIQLHYFSTKEEKDKKRYKKALKKLNKIQDSYEEKCNGMLVNHFIKASKSYNSLNIVENSKDYLKGISDNYFNNINFNSKELYNSSFLVNNVADFVFFLREAKTPLLQEKLYKKSISKVMEVISYNITVKHQIITYFITTFTNKKDTKMVDWLFKEYYDKLPRNIIKQDFKRKKLELLQTSIGRIAPNFYWKEEGKGYSLSSLNDGDNYLLIFWSTTCSHCVKDIPDLYKFMKGFKKTSVIAFAIEGDEFGFNEFTKRLYGWHNVLGTHPKNKFENETVKKYLIDATPTYFILNKNKEIIATPKSIIEVKEYIKDITN
ncbi:MAG: redoxin family protein [Tenacibaculum sp.]|nr:redoxin family protein [Tenacibaculum sp.]